MDKGWLAAFVLFFVFGGGFWVLRPLVAALAKRIAGEHRPVPNPPQRDAIATEVEQLRQEMTEMQERLDFAERLLAKQRGADRLAPPH